MKRNSLTTCVAYRVLESLQHVGLRTYTLLAKSPLADVVVERITKRLVRRQSLLADSSYRG